MSVIDFYILSDIITSSCRYL